MAPVPRASRKGISTGLFIMTTTLKTFCKRGHLLSETRKFHSDTGYPYCSQCRVDLKREDRRNNPEKHARYQRSPANKQAAAARRFILITEDEYNEMWRLQNGECAICRVPSIELTRRLAIDHNHETGEIRGLLCLGCNAGLGMFKEDRGVLYDAIQYLSR